MDGNGVVEMEGWREGNRQQAWRDGRGCGGDCGGEGIG